METGVCRRHYSMNSLLIYVLFLVVTLYCPMLTLHSWNHNKLDWKAVFGYCLSSSLTSALWMAYLKHNCKELVVTNILFPPAYVTVRASNVNHVGWEQTHQFLWIITLVTTNHTLQFPAIQPLLHVIRLRVNSMVIRFTFCRSMSNFHGRGGHDKSDTF